MNKYILLFAALIFINCGNDKQPLLQDGVYDVSIEKTKTDWLGKGGSTVKWKISNTFDENVNDYIYTLSLLKTDWMYLGVYDKEKEVIMFSHVQDFNDQEENCESWNTLYSEIVPDNTTFTGIGKALIIYCDSSGYNKMFEYYNFVGQMEKKDE